MLPKCLFFVSRTPFIGSNMWPFTISTFCLFGFSIRASFMVMGLSTDKALSVGPTGFGRMSETLAVIALLYRNGGTKFLHPINDTCYWTG